MPAYLAARRLLTFEETAIFPPKVTLRSGRSMVFRVTGRASRWIVKQALDRETRRDQRREAAMHRILASHGLLSAAGSEDGLAARLVLEDRRRAILVFEDLPAHAPLSEGIASTAAWEVLGARLAALHCHPPPALAGRAPWVLRLDRPPPAMLRFAGRDRRRLMARVQGSPIWHNVLEDLRTRWRPAGLTHGDLGLDNVLVRCSGYTPDVRLVDWELGGPGHPMADVGWLLGDLLARATEPAGEAARRRAVAAVADATPSLLGGYARATSRSESRLDSAELPRWISARLLLAAFERLDADEGGAGANSCAAARRWIHRAEDLLGRPDAFAGLCSGDPNA